VFASILIVLAAPAASPFDIFERITVQEAAKRVSQCGLGPVTTRHDGELDEDVLIATSAQSATDEQLSCADKAASYYTVELPPNVQPRYDAICKARLSVAFREEARAWLSARGLLGLLPRYQEGVTDDAAFTREIESLCGPRAKGAFESKFGFHALSPDWVEREMDPPGKGEAVFGCLMNATTAAGFQLGFIGNEYYQH
jgi:hypothetical protein